MKQRIGLILLAFSLPFIVEAIDASLNDAYLKGADAKIIYKVVDDAGIPVDGATAHIWFRTTYPKLVIDDWIVNADSNGMFIAAHRTNDRVSCGIDKEGYYHSSDRIIFSNPKVYEKVIDGKWHPYGTTRIVPLRKKKNLGKLRVPPDNKRMCRWKIPFFDKWIGFDLEVFDWVYPVGAGKYDDVLIQFKSDVKNQYFDFRFDMDVCFTNNPYAGFYEREKNKFSKFEWEYNADTNNVFKDSATFWCEKRPGKRGVIKCLPEDSYLVFRTRTKVDENGRLKEAHYGVISGEWISGRETMQISDACFNPVPNDTNIEDGFYLRKAVERHGGQGR